MKWSSSVLLLALAGCTSSKLEPNSDIVVSGTGYAQGGAPLSGAPVVFFKQLDVGELLAGSLQLTASLGTICLFRPSDSSCGGVRTATTDAQGAFSFSLKGSDTQGSLGRASTVDFSMSDSAQAGEAFGAATTQEVQIQVPDLKLNALRLWHPATTLTAMGATVSLTYDAFPYGTAAVGVAFQTDKGIPVWSQSLMSGAGIDARLLEDTQGSVMVTAQTKESLASGGDAVFYYRSGQRPYPKGLSAPISRGAGCFLHSPTGPSALSPCTLTDGDLGTAFKPLTEPTCSNSGGCDAQANNWAYVELPAAAAISLIVVRGVSAPYLVEMSSDAAAWASVGISGGGAQSFTVSASARYVRVRALNAQGRVSGLTEISVW